MIMSTNGNHIDQAQRSTLPSLELGLASFDSPAATVANTTTATNNNTHHLRLVQAAERIEAGTSSKPFHFDMVRLMSILYSQSVSQCSTEKPLGKKPKPLKIQIINGLLHCAYDPSGWTYRVRLAANCFEQNLIAAPLGGIHPDLVTGSLNAFSPISSHHHSRQLRVVLRSTRSIAPGEELAFWPSFDLNLALGIPFLSPSNIINGTCYICTLCGKSYTQPNPLKIHLKFACPAATSASSLPHSQSAGNFSSSSRSLNSITSIKKSSQYLLTAVSETNVCSNLTDKPSRLSSLSNGNNGQSHFSSLVNTFAHHSHRPLKKTISKSTKHNLDGHRKLHSCNYCGKVYTRKYGLKIHIRTHTGLKPLNCRFCGRSFSDPSNLNKHVRLHTQQVPTSSKLMI